MRKRFSGLEIEVIEWYCLHLQQISMDLWILCMDLWILCMDLWILFRSDHLTNFSGQPFISTHGQRRVGQTRNLECRVGQRNYDYRRGESVKFCEKNSGVKTTHAIFFIPKDLEDSRAPPETF